MIVDTMNIEEVGNAVINAARKSVPKVVHVMTEHHKAYMRIVRNSNKERIDFKPLSFVTEGITFYVCEKYYALLAWNGLRRIPR